MEDLLSLNEKAYKDFSFLLFDDVPSTIQEHLCGQVPDFELKLQTEHSQDDSERPRKKQKSQRRVEKEKEWHERQQRMQDNQKAKALSKKKTKCKFFLKGMCKEGAKCPFGHD
jgi:preprotein translocase subunit SecA